MTDMVTATNLQSPGLRAINTAATNIVTNTTTETAFDQVWKFPDQSQHLLTAPTHITIRARGLISTQLVAPAITLRFRWGGISGTVVASTGSLSITSSLSDAGFQLEASMLITSLGASGAMESQGYTSFQSGILTLLSNYMTNASPITFNTQTAADVIVTAQWGAASTSNKIQIFTLMAEVNGP